MLGRLWSIGVWIVLTPIVLHHLGAERFGVWSLLFLLSGYLTTFDLGLGSSVIKFTAHHTAAGEWEEKSPDGNTYKWKEVTRTKEYVELHIVVSDIPSTVRLTARSADYRTGTSTEFKTKFTGKWGN